MEEMARKTCSVCGENKSTQSFDISPRTGRAFPRCKLCRESKIHRNAYKNPAKIDKSRRWCVQCHARFIPLTIYQKLCSPLCEKRWNNAKKIYVDMLPRKIYIGNEVCALVDAEDYDYLSQYHWAIHRGKHSTYAVTTLYFNRRAYQVPMPNIIMETPKGYECDHINHDGLDNRKCNLRICTHQQNMFNKRPAENCSSIYKGVSKYESKWRATITSGGRKHLGTFNTEIKAAKAYDKAAKELFGEFAYLNFPEEIKESIAV